MQTDGPAPARSGAGRLAWRAAILGVWVVLTAVQVSYAARYARNYPVCEEWFDVPTLFGQGSRLDWLFERLHEHRFVLGRAVYLVAFELSGRDYRTGVFLNVGLLAGSALAMIRLADRIRGGPHPVDLALPLLFLNPSHHENILLGYQVAFCLNVLFLSGTLWLATLTDDVSPSVLGSAAGVLMLLFALGGGVGLAVVPPLGIWVSYLAWKLVQARRIRQSLLVMLPAAVAVGWFGWWLVEVSTHPVAGRVPTELATNARVALEFLAQGFGTPALRYWPASGLVAGSLTLVTVVGLVRIAIRQPGQRVQATGWLAVVVAIAGMGLAVGRWRPEGFASRYTSLSIFVPTITILALAAFAPPLRRLGLALGVLVSLTAAFLAWQARSMARESGQFYRTGYDGLAADAQAGVPVNYLGDRYRLFPDPGLPAALAILRDHHHPPVAGARDGPPVEEVLVAATTHVPLPPGPHDAVLLGRPQSWHIDLGSVRPVTGVRVRFSYPRSCQRVTLQLVWTDGTLDTSGRPAYLSTVCYAWLVPGTWELAFWVDAPVREFWIRPLNEEDHLHPERFTLLVPVEHRRGP